MRGEKNQLQMEIMCQGTRTLFLESEQGTKIQFLESLDYNSKTNFRRSYQFCEGSEYLGWEIRLRPLSVAVYGMRYTAYTVKCSLNFCYLKYTLWFESRLRFGLYDIWDRCDSSLPYSALHNFSLDILSITLFHLALSIHLHLSVCPFSLSPSICPSSLRPSIRSFSLSPSTRPFSFSILHLYP